MYVNHPFREGERGEKVDLTRLKKFDVRDFFWTLVGGGGGCERARLNPDIGGWEVVCVKWRGCRITDTEGCGVTYRYEVN